MYRMLPLFPDFEPINLNQKKDVDDLIMEHDPYSDFNFISMYCWDKGDIALSTLHGNLVVRFNDYRNPEKKFLSFLGLSSCSQTAKELLAYSKKELQIDTLHLIPKITAQHLSEEIFDIVPDENQHDYVYSIKEHVELAGSKFKKRRNQIKKFIEDHGHHATITLEQELSDDMWQEMLDTVKNWSNGKKEADAYSNEEYIAFTRLRDCHRLSDFFYFFVMVDKELVGLSVAEVVNQDYVTFHFEKIVPIHGGIGSFAMSEMAKILHQYGFSYINFMQDVGVEGMKRNKQLRRPIHMLEKYIVREK